MSNWTQPGYDPSVHGFHKGVIDGKKDMGYPKKYFFADSLRAIFIAFGTFFNDLFVVRYDENGEPIKQIQVPIKFGPRTKAFDQRTELASGKTYYVTMPNLTYRMSGMQFDATRAAGFNETRMFYQEYFENNGIKTAMATKFWKDVQPVPYNLTITMEAKCEHLSDANQIVEQVMSRFTPACNVNIKEFWFANVRRCIKMKCDSTDIQVTQDFGEETKREIVASFQFTVEAWLYKPIEYGAIIDEIITTLSVGNRNPAVWQQDIKGNYNGSFDERHNFAEIYGTKIGRVSAVIPESVIPKVQNDGSFYSKYEYEELPDITNYPTGSKQMYAVSSVLNPSPDFVNSLYDADGYPNASACSGMIVNSADAAAYNFWYEIDRTDYTPESTASNGRVTIKAYKDLSGYGDFAPTATWRFDTKDADLGTSYIPDCPVMISAGETKV